MNWTQGPIGMIRYDELTNILVGAVEAGLDYDTLAIIARQTGVREFFDRDVALLAKGRVTVERPAQLLLTEAQR